jgi:hypothetical protein
MLFTIFQLRNDFKMRLSMRAFYPAFGLSLVFILSACGGGGGGATPASTNVTVSGRVTYTDFNISAAGIDYANPTNNPIRGAVVELHNPLGTIVTAANTSETGGYSFSAPANSSVVIVVKAALGTPTAPETTVINNTNNNAIYTLTTPVTTVTSNVTTDFNAGSGVDAATRTYTGTRASAPFAILDTIHQGRLFVQAVDAAVVFPALTVQWSTSNKTVAGTQNIAIGDGPGTSYGDPNLWLNGTEGVDTDEYDSTVVAHEWGHYFQEKFSATDSPGGDHTLLVDSVHLSLAFDEGFATAMGSMIMNDTTQINTMGANQATGSILTANIEADGFDDTTDNTVTAAIKQDGYYSENSTIEIVWDLFDSGTEAGDTVALGFAPLYKVMINGQKETGALTSIFSFVHFLKLEVPASSAAIDTLLLGENIITAGANEFESPGSHNLYVPLTLNTRVTQDPNATPLKTLNDFGPTTLTNLGGNKLFNYRFFRATIATAGCYTFIATPIDGAVAASATDLVFAIGGIGTVNQNAVGTAEVLYIGLDAGPVGKIQVGAITDNATFSLRYDPAVSPALCN